MSYFLMPHETDDFDLRYQDRVSSAQFAKAVFSGPMWYNVNTPFRTPRNTDLVEWHNGENRLTWRSSDGGHWWFPVGYAPRRLQRIGTDVEGNYTLGYRLNRADPWVYRAGLEPLARFIYPGVPVVLWPDPAALSIDYVAEEEHQIITAAAAFASGEFVFGVGSDAPSGTFTQWPFTWMYPPIPPDPSLNPGPAPVREHFDTDDGQSAYDAATATWSAASSTWNALNATFASDSSTYATWKSSHQIFVIIKHGRVHRWFCPINSAHYVGLAPFYNPAGKFIGWGAAKKVRVKLTSIETSPVTEWTPYRIWGTGILSSLVEWGEPGNWERIKNESFDPSKDPATFVPEPF